MKARKDFEEAVYNHLQEQGLGNEDINISVIDSLVDFMYRTCLGELLSIDIASHQKELLLQSYKDGFNSAMECLIEANKTIQKTEI